MQHSLKIPSRKFNLLFLDYNECLFNSTTAYSHYIAPYNNRMDKGNLHISSHTLTYESEDLNTPLLKMKFDENSMINFFHFEDLVKLHQILSETQSPDKEKIIPNIKKTRKYVKSHLDDSKLKHIESSEAKLPAVLKISDFEYALNEVLNGTMPVNTNPNSNPIQHHASKAYNNKEAHMLNNQYNDLMMYLNENNVNPAQFAELFNNINKTFQFSLASDIPDRKKDTYAVMLIKTQTIINIHRQNIGRYCETENTRTYMFVLEGEEINMKCFVDDVVLFYEGLSNHEEISFINIVNERKLRELKEKFELKQSAIGYNENNANNFSPNSNYITNNLEGNSKVNLALKNISNMNLNTIMSNTEINPKLRSKNNNELKGKDGNNGLYGSKTVYTCHASRVTPEHCQNGLFVIYENERKDMSTMQILTSTNSKYGDAICEFIPVNNNFSKKVLKFCMSDIKVILIYRYLYNFKGLNIIFYNKKKSKLIDFETEENFRYVYDFMLANCPKLDKGYTDIRYHTNMWVDGLLSNYDYLMYLNFMGGRSFEDLSQYPIMPWVLTNFEDQEILDLNDSKNFRDLSKPIGALNPKRLKKLKENYEELREQGKEFPFLYGTYYSFPSIIFYYLLRSHPDYFLRFQGGNFGPTDRLFYSIKECWTSSYNNPTSQDVKELIPEFYNSDGNFLKNLLCLNLGKTQSDQTVDDVILPKWAKSTKDFISIMRQALECDIVSSKLHLWIDLVFGYKQRGEKALEADNLFHYLRYDDKLHLITDKSEEEKQGEIVNIIEYGQIPIQLFHDPHPKKRSRLSMNEIMLDVNANQSEYFKVAKLKKERVNIEKKYEKERRHKEIEIEEVERKKQEKEKEFEDEILIMIE